MRIGVIGGGQLGRMLALAGHPLGMSFCFLDPSAAAPAAPLGELIQGDFDDINKLAELAAGSDLLTFEFENVPAPALATLPAQPALYPAANALQVAQDRWHEKTLFAKLGIESGPCLPVDSEQQLRKAVAELGLPCVLKTRRLGYDGKGQKVLKTAPDVATAWEELGTQPLILEQFIPFDFEVSLIAVRSTCGEIAFYPLSRNHHRDGILSHSLAPCEEPGLERQAREALGKLLEHLDYVGVLTVEFFAHQGTLLANEMAPRVHNSGHWTIEGAVTSQFENHLRAIAGLPLGSTATTGFSSMVNFIGAMPATSACLALDGCHLHDYVKAPRAGRKLGHATTVSANSRQQQACLESLLALASEAGKPAA